MNEEAVAILKAILKKDVEELKDWEIVFLRARQSYLRPEFLEKYQAVLEPPKPKEPKAKK